MRYSVTATFCLLTVMHAQTAASSDACSTRAIVTAADVKASDGSTFRTESYFHARDAAAVRHVFDKEQIIAVEGSLSWTRAGDAEGVAALEPLRPTPPGIRHICPGVTTCVSSPIVNVSSPSSKSPICSWGWL